MTGGLVGGLPEMEYHQESIALATGSVLALFTDGVTEAGGRVDPREDERLFATVRRYAAGDADALARALLAGAEDLSGGIQRDDIAIVVIDSALLPAAFDDRCPSGVAHVDGSWQGSGS